MSGLWRGRALSIRADETYRLRLLRLAGLGVPPRCGSRPLKLCRLQAEDRSEPLPCYDYHLGGPGIRGSIIVVFDDRVGYGALGDNSDDVTDSWPVNAPEYNGRTGAMAFQSRKHKAE